MDDNLEEIIKIALKANSINTEYYITKYIINIKTELNNIVDLKDKYDTYDSEDSIHYNKYLEQEKKYLSILNRLNRLLLLAGS